MADTQPLWQARGYDPGVLAEVITGIEDGTCFEVGILGESLDGILSFAESEGHREAAVVLRMLSHTGERDAASLTRALGERPPGSVPVEVRAWLWEYAVAAEDFEAAHLLQAAHCAIPRHLIESVSLLESSNPTSGFVYLMVEEGTQPAICKIGQTALDPRVREQHLNASTSQHRRIRLVASWPVKYPRGAERAVFEQLAQSRVNARREFFEIDPRRAIDFLDGMLGPHTVH